MDALTYMLRQLRQETWRSPIVLAVTGGAIALLLALLFLRPPSASTTLRSGPPTILLVGPSDGGKTSLFARLVQNIHPQTHTSVSPSSTTFSLVSPDEPGRTKQIKLVDVPGHPRLREEFTKHVRDAQAVVFVVDIVGIVRHSGTIAEEIPPVLTALANSALRSSSSLSRKILILAHKADLLIRPTPPSVPSPPNLSEQTINTAIERVKSMLTREMDRLKTSRGAAGGRIEGMSRVTGTGSGWWSRLFGGGAVAEADAEGDQDENLIWGGKGPFRWEEVEGVEVEWAASGLGTVAVGKKRAAGDAEEEGDGLDGLKRFLWNV